MPLIAGDTATRRTNQRILGLIFYVAVLAVATWQLVGELRARTLSAESLHWPSVSGEITTSVAKSRTRRRGGVCTWAEICFRYTVDGAPHTSCRAIFRKSGCSASTAAGLMTQFPAGAEVTVFYDPSAPEEAVLVPGSWTGDTVRNCLLLVAIAGFMTALTAWRLARPPEADAAIGDPPPEVPPQV